MTAVTRGVIRLSFCAVRGVETLYISLLSFCPVRGVETHYISLLSFCPVRGVETHYISLLWASLLTSILVLVINTGCPTRYRTRHFFNNFTTNEDIATKFEADLHHCVRNVKEKNILLFKFRCNIFIGVRIIKEMPGSVASGTPCSSSPSSLLRLLVILRRIFYASLSVQEWFAISLLFLSLCCGNGPLNN